ncbi:hypothetical protein KSP40_PGU010070 [Platanthera guangdongensis]|uniref:Uncharacterized protein n=1 Tax=Platanthera guangdongensis TaxID=2320717 RepID=A0ABR2LLX5_9ASPA
MFSTLEKFKILHSRPRERISLSPSSTLTKLGLRRRRTIHFLFRYSTTWHFGSQKICIADVGHQHQTINLFSDPTFDGLLNKLPPFTTHVSNKLGAMNPQVTRFIVFVTMSNRMDEALPSPHELPDLVVDSPDESVAVSRTEPATEGEADLTDDFSDVEELGYPSDSDEDFSSKEME